MTKEKKLEILANCGWGKDGAKARLISGTTIYDAEDFEKIYMNYLKEWGMLDYEDEEEKEEVRKRVEEYRRMVEERDEATDWEIYRDNDGTLYYIQLAL